MWSSLLSFYIIVMNSTEILFDAKWDWMILWSLASICIVPLKKSTFQCQHNMLRSLSFCFATLDLTFLDKRRIEGASATQLPSSLRLPLFSWFQSTRNCFPYWHTNRTSFGSKSVKGSSCSSSSTSSRNRGSCTYSSMQDLPTRSRKSSLQSHPSEDTGYHLCWSDSPICASLWRYCTRTRYYAHNVLDMVAILVCLPKESRMDAHSTRGHQ